MTFTSCNHCKSQIQSLNKWWTTLLTLQYMKITQLTNLFSEWHSIVSCNGQLKNITDYELPQSGTFLRDSEDAARFSTKHRTPCINCCCCILNEIQNESNMILCIHNEKRGLDHLILSQRKKNGISHLPWPLLSGIAVTIPWTRSYWKTSCVKTLCCVLIS